MLTLLQKQQLFPQLMCKLIEFAYSKGYETTLGEFWRPPEMAKLYAAQGKGIANSLHSVRLAIDLNLFKDGKYLTEAIDYKPLGEFWKSLSGVGYECCYGGDFKSGDANHFSIEHNGVR